MLRHMKRFDTGLSSAQLKEKILDAADKRFKTMGFKKTAMAEIADDLGMSTANLYRYFPGKLDIAEGFAIRCFVEKEKSLKLTLEIPDITSVERLKAFASSLLHFNYQQLQNYPAINDIIVALCAERPRLVDRKSSGELELICVILEMGNESGDWLIDDVALVGQAVLTSWVMFASPMFMQLHTLDELEKMLHGVVELTLNGLSKRA